MGITFNRAPISVDTPSSSQVKNYFFNHYEWKGLNDDKNFLSVDQHTFADCNNVYIDSEGLLKSRPSLKVKKITVNINGTVTLGDILDCWTFENVTVYKTYSDETKYYYLTFVNKNNDEARQLPLTYVENEETKTYSEVKLIVADEKIFVFSKYAFEYYDVKDNIVGNAEKFIHIPVTSVIVNGITTSSSKVESKNILTDAYITKYLYSNVNNVSLSKFIGKTVTVTIDDDVYEITFEKNSQVTFVKKYVELNESNFAPSIVAGKKAGENSDTVLGNLGSGDTVNLGKSIYPKYPLYLTSSNENSSLLCECSVSFDTDGNVTSVNWIIYHTVDGLTYTILPSIDNILGIPKISYDGNYCIVFLKDGPYIYSLAKTEEGGYKYSSWTNLMTLRLGGNTLALSDGTVVNINLNEQSKKTGLFMNSIIVNGYFYDDTNFAFTYGCDSTEDNDYPLHGEGTSYVEKYKVYDSAMLVYCIKNSTPKCVKITNKNRKPTTGNKDLSGYITPKSNNIYQFLECMPDVYVRFIEEGSKIKILADYRVAKNKYSEYSYHTRVTLKVINSTITCVRYDDGETDNRDDTCVPILSAMYVDTNFVGSFISWEKYQPAGELLTVIKVITDNNDTLQDRYLYSEHSERRINALFLRVDLNGQVLTNVGLFTVNDYSSLSSNVNHTLTPIPLLFDAQPVGSYENGYVVLKDNYLYRTLYDGDVFTIDEFTEGKTNYFLPSKDALLSNYYFSDSNILYISSPAVNVNVNDDGTISENKIDFEWYLPEINKQEFDYVITNLHPISNTEVAVFFEHSISYVTWDSDVNAYRYYKSKVQAGCKPGCDVLTTFDGKYVIFTSARGLVALTSQEFMATTEQTINYLSDTIFSAYDEYIKDTSLSNGVKLFKHAFWIIAYKPLSKKLFVYDVRNGSWWPITCPENVQKIIVYNDKPEALIVNTIMTLDKSELNYYDYDSEDNKISWFIRSQKLYLDALNYYKHIVNMTFTSSHDRQLLDDANYDTSSISFKLQVNNYRKKVDGYIGDDEYTFVNYTVEAARTYVLRLNYSKVNEFEYLLSSDEENAISIPLSLNSITIKYKIGSQVR